MPALMLGLSQIFRRISQAEMKSYQEIYPDMATGCLLTDTVPETFVNDLRLATKSRRF